MLGFTGRLGLRCETDRGAVSLNRQVAPLLHVVDLALSHQREHSGIEIEFPELLRGSGDLLQIFQGMFEVVEPELQIAGLT